MLYKFQTRIIMFYDVSCKLSCNYFLLVIHMFFPNAVVSICRTDFTTFFAKISEHKIFIGMLPKNVSDAQVSALFSNYGTIKELQLLRSYQQTSKG